MILLGYKIPPYAKGSFIWIGLKSRKHLTCMISLIPRMKVKLLVLTMLFLWICLLAEEGPTSSSMQSSFTEGSWSHCRKLMRDAMQHPSAGSSSTHESSSPLLALRFRLSSTNSSFWDCMFGISAASCRVLKSTSIILLVSALVCTIVIRTPEEKIHSRLITAAPLLKQTCKQMRREASTSQL